MSSRKSRAPARSPSPAPPARGGALAAAADAIGLRRPTAAADATTIIVMPLQYYLRGVFNTQNSDKTPYKGAMFGSNQIAEHMEREIIVHGGMTANELGMAVHMNLPGWEKHGNLKDHPFPSASPPIVAGAYHEPGGFDMTITTTKDGKTVLTPNKNLITMIGRHLGDPSTPGVVAPGLYALNYPDDLSSVLKDNSKDDLSSVFVPLSAITADPDFYCDKERFPRFFNINPDIMALKSDNKMTDRSFHKENDFGKFFKKIVAKAQFWLSLVVILVTSLVGVLMQRGLVLTAVVVVVGAVWAGNKWWYWWIKTFKGRQASDIRYREKWRWIKDDNPLRLWLNFFPLLKFTHVITRIIPGLWEWLEPNFKKFAPDLTKGGADKGNSNTGGGGYRLFGRKWMPTVQTYVLLIVAYITEIYTGWVNFLLTIANALLQHVSPTLFKVLEDISRDAKEMVTDTLWGQLSTLQFNSLATIRCCSHASIRRMLHPEIWAETTTMNGYWPTQMHLFSGAATQQHCDALGEDLLGRDEALPPGLCQHMILKEEDDKLRTLEKTIVFLGVTLVLNLYVLGERQQLVVPIVGAVFLFVWFVLDGFMPFGLGAFVQECNVGSDDVNFRDFSA